MTSQQTMGIRSKWDEANGYDNIISTAIQAARDAGFVVAIDPDENDLDLEFNGVYVLTIEANLPRTEF